MGDNPLVKLMSWNLAGYSGPTKEQQFAEVLEIGPDAIAFQEVVRGSLAFWKDALRHSGYEVLSSPPALLEVEGPMLPHKGHRMGRRKNLNLIAARGAIEPLADLPLPDSGEGFPEKYLAGRIDLDATQFDLHDVHTPPGSTVKMLKVDYWEGVLTRIDEPTEFPRVLCGDFNSPWEETDQGFVVGGGRSDPDEESRWRKAELGFLEHPTLTDVYRARHKGHPFAASYIRGTDTRCRYDHLYVSREFALAKCTCEYREDLRENRLSDHAPLVADLYLN